MRFIGLTATLGLGLAATLTACGPDCQSTCNRLYQEGECNIQSAGNQRSDLLDVCLDSCEAALDNPGPVRETYTPYEYTPSNDGDVTFTTDEEAALWMECVAETNCELMGRTQDASTGQQGGYCAPVW